MIVEMIWMQMSMRLKGDESQAPIETPIVVSCLIEKFEDIFFLEVCF